jgi:hypothetical protein
MIFVCLYWPVNPKQDGHCRGDQVLPKTFISGGYVDYLEKSKGIISEIRQGC